MPAAANAAGIVFCDRRSARIANSVSLAPKFRLFMNPPTSGKTAGAAIASCAAKPGRVIFYSGSSRAGSRGWHKSPLAPELSRAVNVAGTLPLIVPKGIAISQTRDALASSQIAGLDASKSSRDAVLFHGQRVLGADRKIL